MFLIKYPRKWLANANHFRVIGRFIPRTRPATIATRQVLKIPQTLGKAYVLMGPTRLGSLPSPCLFHKVSILLTNLGKQAPS